MEFSKREIITSAWKIIISNLGLMLLVITFIISLNLLLGIVQDRLLKDITLQSILFTGAAYLFQMGLNLGMLRICLNLIYNKEGIFPQLFGSFDLLISYLLASLIALVMLLLSAVPGILLLLFSIAESWGDDSIAISIFVIIVPLIYMSIRLQFYDYFLVDENCQILEAVQKSIAITKGYVMELFLLGAVLSIIVLISIIPLGIGLFISIPLTIIANTYAYNLLKQAH